MSARAPWGAGTRLPPWLAGAAFLAVAAGIVFVAARPLATDDLWWHLAMGERYWQQGPWPESDPLVHTTRDRPPVQHEWLFQVALHHLEGAVGLQGLRVAHGLLAGATLALVFAVLRRAGGSALLGAAAALVFASLSWYRLVQLRPDLVSIPLVALFHALFLAREEPLSARRIAAGCALLAVWANLHSVFAVALALLLAACVGLALQLVLERRLDPSRAPASGRRLRSLLWLLGLGLVASAANPRGPAQHATFFVYSRASAMWSIRDDWRVFNPFAPELGNPALPLLSVVLLEGLLLVLLVLAGAGALRLARERSAQALADLDLPHLALAAAGAVACIGSIRFHWLALFPLLYALRRARAALAPAGGPAPLPAFGLASAALAVALAFPSAARLGAFADEARAGRGYLGAAWLDERFCGAGSRFLAETGLEGNLFNPYYLGGFLAYWHAPRLRTFIDGRMDHYPPEVARDYLAIMRAARIGPASHLRELLARRQVDVFFGVSFPAWYYANLDATTFVDSLPGWVLVFRSRHHSIHLRDHPKNRLNFHRVQAYYRERGLPFDRRRGLDVQALARDAPAWAFEQGLLPPDYRALQRDRRAADPRRRVAALGELAELYWRIGLHEEQVRLDAELAGLLLDDREARRRLAEGLLHLGRIDEGLAVARRLHADAPGYKDIAAILAFGRNLQSAEERRRRRRQGEELIAPG